MKRGAGRQVAGWMMFDWASQPFATLLLTFVFAPYFATVVGDPVRAQALWGWALTLSGLAIALLAPVLGAVADGTGRRMPWIAAFSLLYMVGAAGLWWAAPGAVDRVPWILASFAIGLIGMEFATIFTNAMLPDLGPRHALGRISGTGWAVGYVGGVLSLALVMLFLAENEAGRTFLGRPPALGLDPATREGTRAVGPLTALWYGIFMIPFFMWVRERAPRQRRLRPGPVLRGLAATLRRLPAARSLTAFLGASMLYRDALNGMYTFGGIYALGVLGWSVVDIGIFGIAAAVTGAIFAWIGGRADSRFGPRPVILTCILVLLGTSVLIVTLTREAILGLPVPPGSALPDIAFYIAGGLIGAAGGALQSASRTMLVRQADPDRMTEAFGLYALSGKATAFLAPAAIAIATELTGSQRAGIAPLIALFGLGLVLLVWVKPDGDRAASPCPSAPSCV
ncbi:MAG: MFS transporter [Tranquillimonas sp.]